MEVEDSRHMLKRPIPIKSVLLQCFGINFQRNRCAHEGNVNEVYDDVKYYFYLF